MTTLPLYRPSIQTMEGPGDPHAFTARPDLWPPGSKAQMAPGWNMGPPWAWWYYTRDTAVTRSREAADRGRHLPGHAEAAIIADQVEVGPVSYQTWILADWSTP